MQAECLCSLQNRGVAKTSYFNFSALTAAAAPEKANFIPENLIMKAVFLIEPRYALSGCRKEEWMRNVPLHAIGTYNMQSGSIKIMNKIAIFIPSKGFPTTVCAFLATLALNVDLSPVASLDGFRIEGYPITRYQEVNGNLSDSMTVIAAFFSGFSGDSVLWLPVFFALCMVFRRAAAVKDPRIVKYSAAAAIGFSLLYVVGFSINNYHDLTAVIGSWTAFWKCLVAFTGISLVFYALLAIFFDKAANADLTVKRAAFWGNILDDNNAKAFFGRLAIIFICWLPYLVVYMPGLLLSDTTYQIAQAMGDANLTSHHPVFMTGLFGIFIRFGLLLGSANTGVLLYSLTQMFLAAAAYSHVISHMAKHNVHSFIRIFTFIFFALYPVHAFYAISMWKDTLFSIVFMLLTLKMIDMIACPEEFFTGKKNTFVFALLCTALFLTRNNGLHIVLILLPVLLLIFREHWKRISAIIFVFAVSFAALQAINVALDVQKGSVGEALSIPLQQIARTVAAHGDSLSESDRSLIDSILPYEDLPRLYIPALSDPVKDVFDATVFESAKSAYIKLWWRFLTRYPLACLEAFLCQTHGYWYPDIDEWIAARVVAENNYGIHFEHIVPSFVDNVFSGVFVFRLFPVVSMLVSIGFAAWLTVIMAMVLILKRRYEFLLAFLPAFALWLTCIASPFSGQFRYAYGLFLVLPILAAAALQCGSAIYRGDKTSATP